MKVLIFFFSESSGAEEKITKQIFFFLKYLLWTLCWYLTCIKKLIIGHLAYMEAWHSVSEGKSMWEPVSCLNREEKSTVIFHSLCTALGQHSLSRAADATQPWTGSSISPGLIFKSLIKLLIVILCHMDTILLCQGRHSKKKVWFSNLQKCRSIARAETNASNAVSLITESIRPASSWHSTIFIQRVLELGHMLNEYKATLHHWLWQGDADLCQ